MIHLRITTTAALAAFLWGSSASSSSSSWAASAFASPSLRSSLLTGPSSQTGTSPTLSATSSHAATADTPTTLPEFANQEEYMQYLEGVSALPRGFATGTAKGTFVSVEAPALGNLPISATVIHLTEGPTENWAAVFTQNKFPGAPILVGKSRVAAGTPLHALVINNKVSNVCSGGDGVADSEMVCAAVADALQLPGGGATVLPSSTGVIGWRLPAQEVSAIVPSAVANLQSVSGLNAAKAIMTTDRYPKIRSQTLSNGARVVGIAKGAGMIEPNMATMLSYIMTDATIPRKSLQEILSEVVNVSYNSISVDGDESTSDTVALIASNQVEGCDLQEFKSALQAVCQGLAGDIVRNGEGTGHVIRVVIRNFPGSDLEARRLGRHVVNSPLFKCAVSGNDPNTGRLAAAIGSFMGKFKNDQAVDHMSLTLGGRCIFENGKFVLGGDSVEKEISAHMQDAQYDEHSNYPPHQKFVEIGVDFGNGSGTGTATVLGSDLTNEYISVNADYRS